MSDAYRPRMPPAVGGGKSIDDIVARSLLANLKRDPPPRPSEAKPGHSKTEDADLVASMAKRLSVLEKEVKERSAMMQRIQVENEALKSKLKVAEEEIQKRPKPPPAGGADESVALFHMRTETARLRAQLRYAWKQVAEMKEFLNDYGMVWVGDPELEEGAEGLQAASPSGASEPRNGAGRVSDNGLGNAAGASAAAGAAAHLPPRPPDGERAAGVPRRRISNPGMENALVPLRMAAGSGAAGAAAADRATQASEGQQQQQQPGTSGLPHGPLVPQRVGPAGGAAGAAAADRAVQASEGQHPLQQQQQQPGTSSPAHGPLVPLGKAAGGGAAGAAAADRAAQASASQNPQQHQQQHQQPGTSGPTHGLQQAAPPAALSPPHAKPPAAPPPSSSSAAAAAAPAAPHSRHNSSASTSAGPSPSLPFSMERLVAAVEELNQLAGDGCGAVVAGDHGAKLHMPDSVRLVLFKDGLQVHRLPPKPYSDAASKAILNDVLDGYFPYVLKFDFPNGVPIKVVDRTTESMPLASSASPGNGGNIHSFRDLEEHPSGPEAKEHFLGRLPQTVIKNGKVIEIRSEIGKMVGARQAPGSQKADVALVSTPVDALLSTVQRNHAGPSLPPPSREGASGQGGRQGQEIATLQVKSEDGRQTFILKLQYDDTIAALRKYIDAHRAKLAKEAGPSQPQGKPASPAVSSYEIRSAFPARAYTDPAETLRAAGLIPNATLFLRGLGAS